MSGVHKKGSTVLPVVDAALCVHGRAAFATCRACVDACPTGVFVLGDEGLGVNEELCDGCGVCRPVCPETAIELPFPALQRSDGQDRLALFAACEKSGWKDDGKVVCVHALSRGDLDQLARRGLAEVIFVTGDCLTCAHHCPDTVQTRVANWNAWRHSRGLSTVDLAMLSPGAARKALARYPHFAEQVNSSRRHLLATFLRDEDSVSPVPAGRSGKELYDHRPEIDPDRCTGCDACLRVCPHDCLSFQKGPQPAYLIDPEGCTGCGLCRDVCDDEAVTLAALGRLELERIPLVAARCYRCGAPYHKPQSVTEDDGLCRICSANDPTRHYFQVYD